MADTHWKQGMKERLSEYAAICQAAEFIRPAFESWIEASPYEVKGVLNSEILFLCSILLSQRPKRIFESGRARAQSTVMLSLAFPDTPIVSIEHDAASPDIAIANARLASRPNVDAQFGDSTKLLPTLVQSGDIVLIDGPKGFKALRLAMHLFAGTGCDAIFIHDLYPGMDERNFIEAHFPEAKFSDDYRWAAGVADLDRSADNYLAPLQKIGARADGCGYGYSLTYLPRINGRRYNFLRYWAEISRIVSRIKRRMLE